MTQDTTYDSMNLNKVTLAFSKENENLFLKKYFSDSIFQFRVAFILVTLLYGSFGYLDMQVIPEYASTFHAIRFLFVIPTLVIVFILSFTRLFQKIWQLLLLISFIVGGLGISLMILLAPENYAYFGGMMLVFFAGYFFIKLRFFLATIAGWTVLLAYNAGAIFYAQVPQEILITNNFFFVSANIIGMFAAYNIEYYIRRNFFLNKKYDLERLAVIDANKNLEKTVEERTKELLLAKEKAEESEQKLVEAQALSHVGSWEYIIDTETVTWSKELFNIFERSYDLSAPQYSEQKQHYTKESFAILDKAVQDCVQRDIPFEIELDIITSSGAVKRIISKGRSIKDKNNKIIGSYGTAHDITEKKKTELEIKESEERYKILSEATIEGLCVHDKGIVSDVNDRLVEFLGYPKDELIGMNILNLIADESKDIVRQHSTSGYDKPYEALVLRKNNTTFPTILSGKQIPVNGKIHRIVSVRDVTDQKKYEQELIKAKEKAEESQANVTAIIEGTNNSIWAFNRNYQILYINKAFQQEFLQTFGVQLEPGLSLIDALPKPLQQFWKPRYDRVLANEQFTLEDAIPTEKGNIYIQVSFNPIIKDGEVIGGSCFGSNITSRKLVELELIAAKEKAEESERRLKLASSSGKLGIWDWNVKENKMVWNERMFQLYGIKKETFVNTIDAWVNGLHPEDKERAISESNSALAGIKPFDTEFRVLHPNGKVLHIKAHALVLRDTKGEAERMIGVNRDITENKLNELALVKAKEKAEESDRLKSAFLANMSHEIRTPMNGILGFTNLLQRPNLSGKQQQKYIDIIQKSGTRMLSTVNDIVDISKIESGLVNIKVSEVNISEQMKYLHSFFSPEAAQKGIKLIFKKGMSEKDIKIKTDFEKFNSIVTNLIKNAIKFTDQGSIELGYRTLNENGESKIEFHVKDTGIGIPKHRQKAIFDRFIQADIEDKQAKQGSGLGLAISKAYAEMLGGKMWVDSQEGKGTTFYFTIENNPASK